MHNNRTRVSKAGPRADDGKRYTHCEGCGMPFGKDDHVHVECARKAAKSFRFTDAPASKPMQLELDEQLLEGFTVGELSTRFAKVREDREANGELPPTTHTVEPEYVKIASPGRPRMAYTHHRHNGVKIFG